MKNGFLEAQKLDGTCSICGKPIAELLVQFAGTSGHELKCELCKRLVCSKCYSRSRRKCVQCTTGGTSWCKIPGLPM